MSVRVEVFPVRPVATTERVTVRRAGREKTCIRSARVWYADWHLQRRGAHMHHAQDIFGPIGSPILAPNAGIVTGSSRTVGPTPKGGHWLRLAVVDARGRTLRTYYLAHLNDIPLVGVGDQVEAGQQIGELGRTGNAQTTCPHLHIGARSYVRGRPVPLFAELRRVDPTRAGRTVRPAQSKPRTQATPATQERDAAE